MTEKDCLRRVAMYALKCHRDHNRSMCAAGMGDWFSWYDDQHGISEDWRPFYANLAAVAKSMLMEGT